MRPLSTEFTYDGFDYRLVKRQGDVAIFSQSSGKLVISYEVVIIRVKPAKTFPGGRVVPEREAYPTNEEWGKYAWTCATRERADERFQALVDSSQERQFKDSTSLEQAAETI